VKKAQANAGGDEKASFAIKTTKMENKNQIASVFYNPDAYHDIPIGLLHSHRPALPHSPSPQPLHSSTIPLCTSVQTQL